MKGHIEEEQILKIFHGGRGFGCGRGYGRGRKIG